MQKQFFFLSPVEVVKVTSQNLEEVAKWCGGKVAETESRRVPGRMDSYVWVPTPKGTNISWAFPGMFITKRLVVTVKGELRATWAVFRRDYFEKNYFETPLEAVDATWERSLTEEVEKPVVKVATSIADAMDMAKQPITHPGKKIKKTVTPVDAAKYMHKDLAVHELEVVIEHTPEEKLKQYDEITERTFAKLDDLSITDEQREYAEAIEKKAAQKQNLEANELELAFPGFTD